MAVSEEGAHGGALGDQPRLFTIPPTTPFLDALARAILRGDLPRPGGPAPDALALGRYRILLPTRRACRAMRDAFLRVGEGEAMLLPSIRPLGDVDEEAELFAPVGEGLGHGGLGLDLPPAIGDLERRLAMTGLVLGWSRTMRARAEPGAPDFPAATPAQAVSLATELIRLLDQIESERADLSGLADLAPERFAAHWQLTVAFLEIVTEHWPRHLAEQGVMSPYARRDALMAAETERLERAPPAGPIVAAGSTGSVPATAALLNVIARLPQGAVLLPGLDLVLDDESWATLARDHPEHPQFGMAQLLDRLGATRAGVETLPGTVSDETARARLHLLSEVMRPASTTDRWREAGGTESFAAALRGLKAIEAPTAEDEAEAVALVLRQALETPARTAVLVTPDRVLARRVAARLEKWQLTVDDSAGRPVARTPPGVFLDLVAEVAGSDFPPVTLLGLLKHPLTRLGRQPAAVRHAARVLELIAFRQPRLDSGLEGVRRAMARMRSKIESGAVRHPATRRLTQRDWTAAEKLLDDIVVAFGPLTMLTESNASQPVRAYFAAHVAVAEALARDETGEPAGLWAGDAGEKLALHFAELLSQTSAGPEIAAGDYAEFCRSLLRGAVVRPRRAAHPRLFIWGPLEARLQQADLVIVAGLNEGTWPRLEESDPWLSRPMRDAIGLPLPERRVGLAAHDVAQLMGAGRVVLTRAAKVDGVPTVPSRWILRLQALLQGAGLEGALAPDEPWLAWARLRDRVAAYGSAPRPEPCPPVAARPRRLSVTRVEDWIANPYAIFAREILGLQALDPLAGEPDAALKGQLVHEALHRFAYVYPSALPADAAKALMDIAEELFRELGAHPRVKAFWEPQLQRFARWFAATEPARRDGVSQCFSEVSGKLGVEGPAGPFVLTARADRIDLTASGELVVYDYKTGTPPSAKQVATLMAPQLPLEAAIARAGGFEGLARATVSDLRYVHVLGTREAGVERAATNEAPHALAASALAEVEGLVARFDDPTTPYAALRRPAFHSRYRYDDYAHLARIKEWSDGGQTAE